MSLCLLPKLWHWLNKQVMIWRSRVLSERETDDVCLCLRENADEEMTCLIRVGVCEGVSTPCSSLDWRFTHPLSSPSHPVLTFVFSLLPPLPAGSYSRGGGTHLSHGPVCTFPALI